ncbi:MAG: hypothetical protein EPO16_00045 [Dehalococcoidia bacterium]|nr:MAG: hypothetical protein EPO16_00045 [Dehalococcoidia bacterium]
MAAARHNVSSTRGVFASTVGKIVVVGALVGGSIWALPAIFAAANTVGSSAVGEGTGTVSGYTASAVHYTLNGSTQGNIDAVSFTVNSAPPAGSTMKVKLVSSGSDWYTCTNVTTVVSCDTTSPQATAASANELRVMIAD